MGLCFYVASSHAVNIPKIVCQCGCEEMQQIRFPPISRESLKAQGALLEDNGTQAVHFLPRIKINDGQMINSNNDKKFH